MSFAGYTSISESRFAVTHMLSQRVRNLKPPTALFEGQDFTDLTHALLDTAKHPDVICRISEVTDGYVLVRSGSDGVVFDSAGKIVKESAVWANTDIENCSPAWLASNAKDLSYPIFVGIDPGWWTFYHWFIISVARMGIFLSAFDDEARVAVAPYRDDGSMRFGADVRAQMLKLVVPADRLLTLEDGVYRCPSIRLAWLNHPQQAYISYFDAFRSFMARLRAQAGTMESNGSNRIILLRDYDQRLSDEARSALETMAERDNFSVVRPERLTFQDQAALFANSSCVVAPHGAGLCNILFSSSKSKILELNNQYDGNFVRPWFYLLAAIRGQSYAYLNQTRGTYTAAEIRTMALRFMDDKSECSDQNSPSRL